MCKNTLKKSIYIIYYIYKKYNLQQNTSKIANKPEMEHFCYNEKGEKNTVTCNNFL
jgi:hypothetical protein